jgi:hypothetical protein
MPPTSISPMSHISSSTTCAGCGSCSTPPALVAYYMWAAVPVRSRALAAEDPDGCQEVCEVDADILALAREHLGLRRAPGFRVRHTEGRAHMAKQPDDSWDAIVIDAFVGVRVPTGLITVEALADAARVAPLTLINVVDNRSARDVHAAAAALAVAYPRVWTLGQKAGNTIVAGSTTTRSPDLARVAARVAADPSPGRLTSPGRLAQIIAATQPRHDTGR